MTPLPPRAADVIRKPREWSPRLWEGADFFAWLKILLGNRAAVGLPYWYIAGIVGGMSFTHTWLRWLQNGLYGRRIAETAIEHPPLFVVGHWRTGTTLLHELLILDERHSFPDTFACFVPNHILLSERFFKEKLWFLMPEKRPMDNMAAGWERPQEDEFALCLMGQPSTYADLAFPNRESLFPGSLDLSGLTPRQLHDWKRAFRRFIQTLTFRDRRRLVLKSPPHTARIPTLLELFPDAKFVYIQRDPHVLFSSTVNLWRSLGKKHGLQTQANDAMIEEKVFREFRTIHERYDAAKGSIPPGNLVEVRYEELVKDLVGGMERVYDGLSLGGFETVRPRIDGYAARNKNYETNKYEQSPELRARIRDRWGDIIEKQGYA
jgi:omega-hydroxy-beta-dihydromenaquinone-9 sulfotransferase